MFSPTFLSGSEALSATTVWIAIAALLCLLCAEIAGICILISKFKQVRNTPKDSAKRHYGIGVFLLAAGIGQSEYTALIVLSVLVGLGALALVGLVVALRVMGYEFMPSAKLRKKEQIPAQPVSKSEEPVEEAPVYEEPAFEEPEDEEPVCEVFEEELLFEEDFEEEAYPQEEEYEVSATLEVDMPEEETEKLDSTVGEESAPDAATEEIAAVLVDNDESAMDDGQPYRVVEKVVTETVKEVYKEAPQQSGGVNDSVVEKLVDLLDYELRTRRELELADAAKKTAGDGTAVAAFAAAAAVADEDEEDDEDANDELEDSASDLSEDGDAENDPDSDRFTGNERIIGFNEVTGCYIVAHYRKSFEAKLIQARPNIKQYYSELKNALLSYKGTKNRISWTADSFHNGRTPIAKINVKTRILEIYLALDPDSLEGTVYRGKNVGDKKKYADTPFQYKLRTPRKFKWAMELVQRVCEEKGLTPIDIEKVDYEAQYPFDTTENLVERKLIKEYIREEKPASSFELDPDHVPEALTEDETVIPANANFSWEFDNERMVDKEPEPIPEIVEEPREEAPVAEAIADVLAKVDPPAASTSDVVRETVKVTETRYTERYFADKPVSEQEVIVSEVVETSENTEQIKEDADEVSAAEQNEDSGEVLEAEQNEDGGETLEAEDPLRSHEIVYADDDSYGADVVYVPVAVRAEADNDEEPDVSAYEEDDGEPIFGNAFEEVPYEEAPFEYEMNTAVSEKEPAVEEYSEEVEQEVFQQENFQEDDGAVFEPIPEDTYGQAEEDAAEEPEQADRRTYRESYGEQHPFEETYAQETVSHEPPARSYAIPARARFNPSVAVIDICSVEAAFRAGEVISLDTLKERGLVLSGVSTLHIYASGPIGKAFTVEANQITVDAVRVISAAHGEAIMVR